MKKSITLMSACVRTGIAACENRGTAPDIDDLRAQNEFDLAQNERREPVSGREDQQDQQTGGTPQAGAKYTR